MKRKQTLTFAVLDPNTAEVFSEALKKILVEKLAEQWRN